MANGKGDIVTVSVFRDAATANAANARVRDWVQANLARPAASTRPR